MPCYRPTAHQAHEWGTENQYLCPGQGNDYEAQARKRGVAHTRTDCPECGNPAIGYAYMPGTPPGANGIIGSTCGEHWWPIDPSTKPSQPQTAPVCFVDVETTGLHADRHEIWEVGLIDAAGDEHSWMLNVGGLTGADPYSLAVGRFHERHPQGNLIDPAEAPKITTRLDFAHKFSRLTHGAHLAGAVISFDEERLRRLLWTNNVAHGWHYHLIDVEALAAGFIAGTWNTVNNLGHGDPKADGYTRDEALEAIPPWDSNRLSRLVGVDPDDYDRHTALGDCRWAKAIYYAVLGKP